MIVVTGATGILGRVIVLYLLKQGKQVRATKRPTSNLEEVRQSFRFYTEEADAWFNKIEWMEVDFEDLDSIANVLKGADEVYHCAAHVSFNPNACKEIYRTNVVGTRNLLYACEGSTVKKFLFVSSIAVLDGINEQGFLDEDAEYNPKLNHSSYAYSKYFSEMEVWRAEAEGLNVVVINPGVIIGSGNWEQSSGLFLKNFSRLPYVPSGLTAYVDVRDVATIAIQLMEQNKMGERFIVISENSSYEQVGNMIRKELGLKPLKRISNRVLSYLRIFSIFGWLVPSLRLTSKANLQSLMNQTKIDNSKVKKVLQYSFIRVQESIKFHLTNYKEDTRNT